MTRATDVTLTISIDTEEDDWGSYAERGASTKNILRLPELQEIFDRWGARPSYLVNYPPLIDAGSVEVLGALAERPNVEIGGHCHPWNTPPLTSGGVERSMMCTLSADENRSKLREVRDRLKAELGIEPKTFRTGRWGLGPTVAGPLADEGFEIDCSVSPFMDWSPNGPDFSEAPHRPYRFDPARPLEPDPEGRLLELPTTIGFLRGDHRRRAGIRRRLEGSPLRHMKVVGILDRAGILAKRWLSPEPSSTSTMIQLAKACIASGERFLQLTFHSPTLLPGATPFVRTEDDKARFLQSVDDFLAYCSEAGYTFRTLSEAGLVLDPRREPDPTAMS